MVAAVGEVMTAFGHDAWGASCGFEPAKGMILLNALGWHLLLPSS